MVIVSRENHLDGDCNGHCQQRKSFRWGFAMLIDSINHHLDRDLQC